MKNNNRFQIGTGISSILMIFLVLCLTTFGILSYSSAKADYNLTEKNGEFIGAYYDADAAAQEILAEIDGIILEARNAADDESVFLETTKSLLNVSDSGLTITEGISNAGLSVFYQVDVNNQQYLDIQIDIFPLNEKEHYQVISYQLSQKENAGGVSIEDETAGGLWQSN